MNNRSRYRLSIFIWHLFATVSVLFAISSCVSSPETQPWNYADLRIIDSLAAPSPATDILAVYTRTSDLSVDIRVDLLDINPGDKYTLKIVLWDNRDLSHDPLKISIFSSGMVQTSGIREGMSTIWPRVVQDHRLDTITISLNRFLIGKRYHLDVSTYINDPDNLADEVNNVRSDAQPPQNRAPILVAFWDAFPTATPAQALRRWDGAHTGPLGGRHGLMLNLDAVRRNRIPVALLDIKNPSSLAALSFMGNIPKLVDLNARGLLILPDVVYGFPSDVALTFSRRSAGGFGLPTSQFIYTPSQNTAAMHGYRAGFQPLPDKTHILISDGRRLIPLPSSDSVEATRDGPALDVRRSMINVALSADTTDLVVLGGSLPHSTWGDVEMVYPTFEWIAAHPWIQPLASPDLLTFPAHTQQVSLAPVEINPVWLEALRSAPNNVITQSAWQTYLTLTSATADSQLQALQGAYLGQVGELLEAAHWAENRTPRVDCTQDLDNDGHAECILANQNYFAVLDPVGARLSHFFHVDESGPHQLIGPSSQFTVGLSDPTEWDIGRGEAADPSVIPGAFADDTGTWMTYAPTIHAGEISFTNPDNTWVKTYHLVENGIQVLYQLDGSVSTRIPVALDPQAFYSGPTNYRAALTPHSWTWSLAGRGSIEVRTDALLTADGFITAIPFLALPEDPNLDYPKGNYLPFPLSVVAIQSNGNFSVQVIGK